MRNGNPEIDPRRFADVEKTQAPIQANERAYLRGGDCVETSRPMGDAEILAELFRYHPPTPQSLPKYAAINQAAKNFAEVILQNCRSGSDRQAAILKLREARMLANASIALDGLSLY